MYGRLNPIPSSLEGDLEIFTPSDSSTLWTIHKCRFLCTAVLFLIRRSIMLGKNRMVQNSHRKIPTAKNPDFSGFCGNRARIRRLDSNQMLCVHIREGR
jgi:hypothetical protein